MADFSRKNVGLNPAFPPSAAGGFHQPGHLDENVQLVHPFLGPLEALERPELVSVTSAAAGAFVDSPEAGPRECFYVPAAFISQQDAAQVVRFDLFSAPLSFAVSLYQSRETPVANWPANVPFPLNRSIIVPPGFRIRALRETGGAGTITLQLPMYRLSVAEVGPNL